MNSRRPVNSDVQRALISMGKRILLLSIWGAAALYSMLCIWIAEIRPYWAGSWFFEIEAKKFGTLTCVGFSIVFCSIAIIDFLERAIKEAKERVAWLSHEA